MTSQFSFDHPLKALYVLSFPVEGSERDVLEYIGWFAEGLDVQGTCGSESFAFENVDVEEINIAVGRASLNGHFKIEILGECGDEIQC